MTAGEIRGQTAPKLMFCELKAKGGITVKSHLRNKVPHKRVLNFPIVLVEWNPLS